MTALLGVWAACEPTAQQTFVAGQETAESAPGMAAALPGAEAPAGAAIKANVTRVAATAAVSPLMVRRASRAGAAARDTEVITRGPFVGYCRRGRCGADLGS